jgi:hypothetical protein
LLLFGFALFCFLFLFLQDLLSFLPVNVKAMANYIKPHFWEDIEFLRYIKSYLTATFWNMSLLSNTLALHYNLILNGVWKTYTILHTWQTLTLIFSHRTIPKLVSIVLSKYSKLPPSIKLSMNIFVESRT